MKRMKTALMLAVATMMAIGSVGCANRSMRSVFHRGAPCGATMTAPLVSDVTSYSPTCGIDDCPTCGTTGGMPVYTEGYPIDASAMPYPVP